jgi:hypothetical protein
MTLSEIHVAVEEAMRLVSRASSSCVPVMPNEETAEKPQAPLSSVLSRCTTRTLAAC